MGRMTDEEFCSKLLLSTSGLRGRLQFSAEPSLLSTPGPSMPNLFLVLAGAKVLHCAQRLADLVAGRHEEDFPSHRARQPLARTTIILPIYRYAPKETCIYRRRQNIFGERRRRRQGGGGGGGGGDGAQTGVGADRSWSRKSSA